MALKLAGDQLVLAEKLWLSLIAHMRLTAISVPVA
jgi:hypothetical protein